MKQYFRVLTIAGSDSGGGAGIQADIKTISACGGYAASAITAITAQNTLGVQAVVPVPVACVRQQITAVLEDIGADAVKIGMLHSAEVVHTVATTLQPFAIRNIVLDPVMVSTSGHRLIEDSATQSLLHDLIPMARVITPNLPEAEVLLGRKDIREGELSEAAEALAHLTGVSVLLKAGHLDADQLTDVLYSVEDKQVYTYSSPRIHTCNTHGTGCTLSSAVAAYLAKGLALPEAIGAAKTYLDNAIRVGAEYKIGHGFGPVAHR